jgi:hypothetical protein
VKRTATNHAVVWVNCNLKLLNVFEQLHGLFAEHHSAVNIGLKHLSNAGNITGMRWAHGE